jgi:hypothetical protein
VIDNPIPPNLVFTKEDFLSCNLDEVLNEVEPKTYSNYSRKLMDCAKIENTNNSLNKGKILALLANVCNLILNPDSTNQPYQFLFVLEGYKSDIEDYLTESDLDFFDEILPEINDFRIKARIADLLWLLKTPRDHKQALSAIESYIKFPLDADKVLVDGRDCWKRAIILSKLLRKPAEMLRNEIKNILLDYFRKAEPEDTFHALWLAQLLFLYSLDELDVKDIIFKLEMLSLFEKSKSNFNNSRDYLYQALEWCNAYHFEEEKITLNEEIAELFIIEASLQPERDSMGAAFFYENAIKHLRTIPNKDRQLAQIDEKIAEIHKKMKISNKLALDYLSLKKTKPMDISPIVEASFNQVSGLIIDHAIYSFVNCFSKVKSKEIIEEAKNICTSNPIHILFPSSRLSNDGRVVAKTDGFNIKDPNSAESLNVIREKAIEINRFHVEYTVISQLLPALGTITMEHRVTENYVLSICRNSHLVEQNRVNLWARGLYQGFERNFDIALHLLIPQIEHLVRSTLQKYGEITTTFIDGIDTESGLSTLMKNPNITNYIQEDLVFELKALLTEQAGSNLRNEMAHGLLDWNSSMSYCSIYLWWLALKLIVISSTWFEKPEIKE